MLYFILMMYSRKLFVNVVSLYRLTENISVDVSLKITRFYSATNF